MNVVKFDPSLSSRRSTEAARDMTLAGWNVVLCAPLGQERLMIPEWVAQRGGNPLLTSSCPELLRAYVGTQGEPTMIVLVASPACKASEIIERCQTLQAVAPDAPLVLVLQSPMADDFTINRRAPCDIILRAPLTSWAFGAGIRAAIQEAAERTDREARRGAAGQAEAGAGRIGAIRPTAAKPPAAKEQDLVLRIATRIAAGMVLGWGAGLNSVLTLIA